MSINTEGFCLLFVQLCCSYLGDVSVWNNVYYCADFDCDNLCHAFFCLPLF